MKYQRIKQRNIVSRIWERWDLEYFDRVFYKMLARKKDNGFGTYKNGAEAFHELNHKYKSTFGKERFSSYNSYIAVKSQKRSKK